MKLSKAFEVNEGIIAFFEMDGFQECADAIKLGSEALKRILAWRNDNDEDLLWDLPGETPEADSP